MSEITTVGWIIISVCGLFLLATNISLIALLRRRGNRQSSPNNPLGNIQKFLQNPWSEEDQRWQELSRRVEGYKTPDDREKENPEQK